jgi:hypothetical protein
VLFEWGNLQGRGGVKKKLHMIYAYRYYIDTHRPILFIIDNDIHMDVYIYIYIFRPWHPFLPHPSLTLPSSLPSSLDIISSMISFFKLFTAPTGEGGREEGREGEKYGFLPFFLPLAVPSSLPSSLY